MRDLLLRQQAIVLTGLHPEQVLRVLTDHVDAATAGGVGKADAQSVSAYGVDDLLAVDALVEAHLLLVGWAFAVSAGLVGLFLDDVECPEAR